MIAYKISHGLLKSLGADSTVTDWFKTSFARDPEVPLKRALDLILARQEVDILSSLYAAMALRTPPRRLCGLAVSLARETEARWPTSHRQQCQDLLDLLQDFSCGSALDLDRMREPTSSITAGIQRAAHVGPPDWCLMTVAGAAAVAKAATQAEEARNVSRQVVAAAHVRGDYRTGDLLARMLSEERSPDLHGALRLLVGSAIRALVGPNEELPVEFWRQQFDALVVALSSRKGEIAIPPGTTPITVVAATGPAHFRSLTEAVKHAPEGSQVLVRPGHYRDSVTIVRSIDIRGDGPKDKIIVESSEGAAISILGEGKVSLRHLTIRSLTGGRPGPDQYNALQILSGDHIVEDCDFAATSYSAVVLRGPKSSAVFRRCHIQSDKGCGLIVDGGARGHFDDIDVHHCAVTGMTIEDSPCATVRRSRFYENAGPGMGILRASAKVEDSAFYNNQAHDLVVIDRCAPEIRRCTMRDGRGSGLSFRHGARPLVEDCLISGHREGEVAIGMRAVATFLRCEVRNGQHCGVILWEQAEGRFTECTVRDNAMVGVGATEASQVLLDRCVVSGNGDGGVSAREVSAIQVVGTDLNRNQGMGLISLESSVIQTHQSQISHHPLGAVVLKHGRLTMESCDLFSNGTGVDCREGEAIVRRCRVNWNDRAGVWFREHGRGTVADSDLTLNPAATVVDNPFSVDLSNNRT